MTRPAANSSARELPLVSVVTPSFNMGSFLPETIESVLQQDYPRIEQIVMDGGSSDNTIAVLRQYGDRISFTSEPDAGPADAILQGMRRAAGDILLWLNADDTLLPGAVREAVDYLQAHPEIDVVYGRGWWVDEHGSRIGPYPTAPFNLELLARECFICQPAAFIRASAYRECEIDPSVTCAFDYDLWIRLAKAGRRFAHVTAFLATSRMHSGGLTLRERDRVFHSSIDVLRRHFGYVPLPWVFGYTCFRIDGRDQFFHPLRPSASKYLAALAMGLRLNRRAPVRFVTEWALKPFGAAFRKLARR